MLTRSSIRILLGLLASCSLPPAASHADVAVPLAEDQQPLDMRWLDSETVVLVSTDGEELSVSLLDAVEGMSTQLELPRALQRAGEQDGRYSIRLAPLGNGISVVGRDESPLSASRLSAYSISRDGVETQPAYRIPMEFWPGAICWDEAGTSLFAAARPYLQPGQETAVGTFRFDKGSFIPLLERSELDLISAMAFLPASGELAILCGSHDGQFPEMQMLVVVNPDGNRTRIVHAQAGESGLQLLDNGDLLLHSNEDDSTWLMPAGEDSLLELTGDGLPAWDCQQSRDGNWLAGRRSTVDSAVLLLQRADGSLAYELAIDSSLFRFNADGSRIAVYDPGSHSLQMIGTGQEAAAD